MAHTFSELYQKVRPRAEPERDINALFEVRKADDEMRIVFGWASVASAADGEPIVDWQRDVIDISDLEKAVYNYVLLYRDGGEMHERGGVATLVESIVFTADKMTALGIPEGVLPFGWWIGLKVTDDDVWEKVKSGDYRMFSIEGSGIRQEVDLEERSGQ